MPETAVIDGAAEINAATDINDITKSAQARTDAEAFGEEESSPSEKKASEKTGEVEKTQEAKKEEASGTEEGQEEKEIAALEEKGEPIPFERFKKVISQRNELRDAHQTLESEYAKLAEIINTSEVLPVVLKKLGYSDERIAQELRERKIAKEDKAEPDEVNKQLSALAKDLDLTTTEGWALYQYRIAQLAAENKAKEKINEYDQGRMSEEEAKGFVSAQEKEAQKLCKDVYNIAYGEAGKDDVKRNKETALGKIAAYLDKNPEDAYLGHVKLLRLALADEGFKLGERKGIEKEKERISQVKKAALEGDGTSRSEGIPNSSWSIQQIMDWRKTHPNVEI